jgi:hypothetical protein
VDLLSLYGYLSKSDIRTIQHFVVDLKDSLTKKAKHSMAELSRPGCAEREVAHNKNKKTVGKKHIHKVKDAKYMNWHTLFL